MKRGGQFFSKILYKNYSQNIVILKNHLYSDFTYDVNIPGQ
jgi:hypothetical protein